MASSNESQGGCLSAFCICLKRRDKPRPETTQSPLPTAVLASQATCHSKPSSQAPKDDQKPALTIPQVKAPGSPSAKSPMSSSAPDTDNVPSSIPTSKGQTSATDSSATMLSLWQKAYASVDQKTRDWLDSIPPVADATDPVPELVRLVRSSEDKHKDEALKLKVGNREILWRDYANRVVSVMAAMGDIAINFAPAPSLMIWSAVRVLLKTNVSERQDLVAIMGCTDMILCLLRRGRVYEEVYIGELPRPATQQDLEKRLVEIYTTYLEFLFFVNEELKNGNLNRFLDVLLDPG